MKALKIFNDLHMSLMNTGAATIHCTASTYNDLRLLLAQRRRENPEYFEFVLSCALLPEREWTRGERGGLLNRAVSLRYRQDSEASRSPHQDSKARFSPPLPIGLDTNSGKVSPEMDAHFRAKHGLPAEGFVPVDMERVRRRVEEMRATGAGAGLQNTFAEGQTQQDSLQDSEERPPEHDPWTGFFDKFRDSDSAQDSETGLQNPKPDGDA